MRKELGDQPHHQATNHPDKVGLLDSLHGGAYWPFQEGVGRNRRPLPHLGVELERGYWEEHLLRELSSEHGRVWLPTCLPTVGATVTGALQGGYKRC